MRSIQRESVSKLGHTWKTRNCEPEGVDTFCIASKLPIMDHEDKINRGRELRSNMSLPEVILWKLIRRDQLGYRVRRQQPFEGYFLDIYIRELLVAIEVDGRIHEGQEAYDQRRDKILRMKGLTIIRINASSIFTDANSVVEYLNVRLAEIAESR